MTCTFFGNRNTPSDIQPKLEEILEEYIKNNKADKFYVGNHGSFDSMVLTTLRKLKKIYPHIDYTVVLAYMPTEKDNIYDYSETLYPEGLETVPQRFAIDRRNRWMLEKSDMVIAYARNDYSCSAKYMKLARNKKKEIINIFEIKN
ncbi:MAG: hypothetical protein IJA12_01525 [Oscillospiraceae bacterium]|nr:hypothetical protein [Oscillospiraceae bacterium]